MSITKPPPAARFFPTPQSQPNGPTPTFGRPAPAPQQHAALDPRSPQFAGSGAAPRKAPPLFMQRDDAMKAVRNKLLTGTQANSIANASGYEKLIPEKYLRTSGQLNLRGKMSGAFASSYKRQEEYKVDNLRLCAGERHLSFNSLAQVYNGHPVSSVERHASSWPQPNTAQNESTGYAPRPQKWQPTQGYVPQQAYRQAKPAKTSSGVGNFFLAVGRGILSLG